jgi:crossover junction endodeoxyribonuclease RuvC
MGHVRGVVLLAAQQAGIVVRNLEATKIKKSLTGNGHASKQQVQRAIQSLCNLPHLPAPPDVADALAIALCAERHG